MTGFDSKRQAAQAKLDDDDAQGYIADALLISYQSGFADGKRSAQRPWVGLTDEEIDDIYWGAGKHDLLNARAIEAKLKERNT